MDISNHSLTKFHGSMLTLYFHRYHSFLLYLPRHYIKLSLKSNFAQLINDCAMQCAK